MNEMISELKKRGASIGWRYAIFVVVAMGLQVAMQLIIKVVKPQLFETNTAEIAFIAVMVSVDLIGFPVLFLLTRNLSVNKPEQHKMTIGQFLICVTFGAGLCLAGSIIGTPIHYLLMLMRGTSMEDVNYLGTLMMESNPWIRIAAVGILAPIFEELIFRKLLVDRVVKYGEWAAILMSGLMFGIFHGNFSQFFYATGLGLFFAYIYVRTGKIWYTILFHMIINMSSSVITITLSQKFLKASELLGGDGVLPEAEVTANEMQALPAMLPYIIWMMFLGCISIAGLILLIVKRKQFFLRPTEDVKKSKMSGAALNNWGMWIFYACGLALFLFNYIG